MSSEEAPFGDEDRLLLHNNSNNNNNNNNNHKTTGYNATVTNESSNNNNNNNNDNASSPPPGYATASIPNEVFNLIKNIVGSGGLSLPSGVAAFANQSTALIPSIVLIIFMGIINAYSFSLLGRVCAATGAQTYHQAWDQTTIVVTTGSSSSSSSSSSLSKQQQQQKQRWKSFLVNVTVVGKTLLGDWAFSIMLGSSIKPILVAMGFVHATRVHALLGVTILVLLPLCLKRNLSSLAGFSVVGQFGTMLTITAMTIRYFDGSYREGGKFYNDVEDQYKPDFGSDGGGANAIFKPEALILVCILSTGYIAHYNAPKFHYELIDNTTERFNIVVIVSFLLSGFTYASVASLGFLTFGASSAGFILDNYSPHDGLINSARIGIVLALLFAYPLLFIGSRDGVLDFVGIPSDHRTDFVLRMTSVILLSCITMVAILIPNLTFVLAFGGATLSTAITYVMPALMFRSIADKDMMMMMESTTTTTMTTSVLWLKREVWAANAMMYLGIVTGACGAVIAVKNALG